jgi:hypothetical protein
MQETCKYFAFFFVKKNFFFKYSIIHMNHPCPGYNILLNRPNLSTLNLFAFFSSFVRDNPLKQKLSTVFFLFFFHFVLFILMWVIIAILFNISFLTISQNNLSTISSRNTSLLRILPFLIYGLYC